MTEPTLRRSSPLLALLASCAAPDLATLRRADGRLVAQLVHPDFVANAAAATCKPWHELIADDGRVLTKGLGGTFPHHRGLFAGWNQVRRGSERFDFWHCNRGESQRVRTLTQTLVAGHPRQTTTIDWCAANGDVVVHEQRTVELHEGADGTCTLQVELQLRAADGEVQLGGDPQHAGCQFRAVQAFADEGAPKVRYLRPTGARGSADDVWTDCPWIAAVLPFPDGAPVTVLRIEAGDNPPAVWSTRPYGRFGAMWSTTLRAEAPTTLRCAWVIASGDHDAAWCAAKAAASAPPPR